MTIEKIYISQTNFETRVVATKNKQVLDYFFERSAKRRILGTIFIGIVQRILPGINSAFVDIGLEKSGFLFGADLIDPMVTPNKYPSVAMNERHTKVALNKKPIEKVLKHGQRVLVQVIKEALGSKGPRLTMAITLPGRYLVLMPNFRNVGVSRRINCEKERMRLKSVVEDLVPVGAGIIIRTAADTASTTDLLLDLEHIKADWQKLALSSSSKAAPAIAFQDLSLAKKTIRDLLDKNTKEIIVDDPNLQKEISNFLLELNPLSHVKVGLHPEKASLFTDYGIEQQIENSLEARVELKSGAYLIIEETEALSTFDVNTGSFVGNTQARQTILKTNLEAAKTIAEQIRLRNIGGIIVIDFIDMIDFEDQELVLETFLESLKNDRAKTNVLKFSEIGLVQMTRKRSSDSIIKQLTIPCQRCNGRGRIKSMETETFDLLRKLQSLKSHHGKINLDVTLSDEMSIWIKSNTDLLQDTLLYSSEVTLKTRNTSESKIKPPLRSFSIELNGH